MKNITLYSLITLLMCLLCEVKAQGTLTFTCPSSATIFKTATPNSDFTIVNYPPAIVVSTCTPSNAVSLIYSTPSGSAFPIGTTTVIVTATDNCNHVASCVFDVTISSVRLACNDGDGSSQFILSENGNRFPPANSFPITLVTTCPLSNEIALVSSVNNITINPNTYVFPIGTTTVTTIASDVCQNTDQCAYTVLRTAQTINCPSNVVLTAATGTTGAPYNYTLPSASSTCPTGSVVVTAGLSNMPSGTTFIIGTTTLSFTATDGCGNSKICSYTVTVNAAPTGVLSVNCPTNKTFTAAQGATSVIYSYNMPVFTSTCTVGSVAVTASSSNIASGSMFPVGTSTLSFTATDGCGNNKICSYTVTVQASISNPCDNDVTPPVLRHCPSNMTVTTSSACKKVEFAKPTATDNCSSTPSVIGTHDDDFCFPVGTTTVTYTAKDHKNNTSTCSFTVKIVQEVGGVNCNDVSVTQQRGEITVSNLNVARYIIGIFKVVDRFGSTSKVFTCNNLYTTQLCAFPTTLEAGKYRVDIQMFSQNFSQKCVRSQLITVEEGAAIRSVTVFNVEANAVLNRSRIDFISNQGLVLDYFTVQKFDNTASNFEDMDIINNDQIDDNLQYHTVYDAAPEEGDNFYRIKLTYLTGAVDYSPTQKVTFKNTLLPRVFPNPTSDEALIDMKNYAGKTVELVVSNVAGDPIRREKINQIGANPYTLNVSKFPNGTYFISLRAQGKREVSLKLQVFR